METIKDGQQHASHTDLERIFDSQITTLKARGCPAVILENKLQKQRPHVLRTASAMTFGFAQGFVAFLPVIPSTWRSIHDLVTMVRHNDEVGCTYAEPTEISDVVETPGDPYYMFDVEDGTATLGKNPLTVARVLKKQSRSPLTTAEVVALCTHTDVLKRHHEYASGSRGKLAKEIPRLYLSIDCQPVLSVDWVHYTPSSHRYHGIPSCAVRIPPRFS